MLNRISKVIHLGAFFIGLLFLYIMTTGYYGFFYGLIAFILINGSGFIISYILSGNKNFLPFY